MYWQYRCNGAAYPVSQFFFIGKFILKNNPSSEPVEVSLFLRNFIVIVNY